MNKIFDILYYVILFIMTVFAAIFGADLVVKIMDGVIYRIEQKEIHRA